MEHNETIILYQWIQDQFTPDSPEALKAINVLGSEMAQLANAGDQILDLCCGAGTWSFFFEDRGAPVTGIDFVPCMIDRARREAERRGSTVDFIVADVLSHDFGEERFDIAVLMGNTVADMAPSDFSELVRRVHRSLKPRGRFAIHYIDGVAYFDRERLLGQSVEQEEPSLITRRYKEYRPDDGAWVVVYTNESTGDVIDYTSYVYPTPLLRLILEPFFTLTDSIRCGEAAFLDICTKRDRSPAT